MNISDSPDRISGTIDGFDFGVTAYAGGTGTDVAVGGFAADARAAFATGALPAAAGAAPAVQVSKPAAPAGGAGTKVNSPLPGVVLGLSVKEGDTVKKGQGILVLEAMKMENTIEAPCDGTLKQFMVQKGDSVLEGATLAIIG